MNKVFKVVFNKSLGAWTVVSEFAKGHTKTKSVKVAGGCSNVLKLTTLATVMMVGVQANAWTTINQAEHTSNTATVQAGETAVKIDRVTSNNKKEVISGELNRSGNPVRIVWYGNSSDSDGHTAQTKADNKGYIQGRVIADPTTESPAKRSNSKDEHWTSITIEGQGNAIDALGWSAHTNANDVEITLDTIRNEGVAKGEGQFQAGLGVVNSRIRTYGTANGISVVSSADFGQSISGASGASGTSAATKVTVTEEAADEVADDLTASNTVSSADTTQSDQDGKKLAIAITNIQNTGLLSGTARAFGNEEIKKIAATYTPRFYSTRLSATANGVSVASFIDTPDQYAAAQKDYVNQIAVGSITNSGTIQGDAYLTGGKNTTHTNTVSRGTGNGVSIFAATGRFASNPTFAALLGASTQADIDAFGGRYKKAVNNSGKIAGQLKQISGDNDGTVQGSDGYKTGSQIDSTAQSVGSGNGISVMSETTRSGSQNMALLGEVNNSGRITGFADVRSGNGAGDMSVEVIGSGNGVISYSKIGNGLGGVGNAQLKGVNNSGIISGNIYTKAGKYLLAGTTVADEQAQVVITDLTGRYTTSGSHYPASPEAGTTSNTINHGSSTRAGSTVYGSGSGIVAYEGNYTLSPRVDTEENFTGSELGNIKNSGVVSGYAEMYHGFNATQHSAYSSSVPNGWQRVDFLGVGTGIFNDGPIKSTIDNTGIISGNHSALLGKGIYGDRYSGGNSSYKSGYTKATVNNYGLMAGTMIMGNYRAGDNLDSGLQAYRYYEIASDPSLKNKGTLVYLKNGATKTSSYPYTNTRNADAETIDRIVAAADSTVAIDGVNYDIKNAAAPTGAKDSELAVSSNLAKTIINGVGLAQGAAVAEGEIGLDDSIVNGFVSALYLKDNAKISANNTAFNTNGFEIKTTTGKIQPLAVKGSDGNNELTLSGNAYINGNANFGAGDDKLTISGGNVQVNGQLVDMGAGSDTVALKEGTESNPVNVNYNIANAEDITVDGVAKIAYDAKIRGVNKITINDNAKLIYQVADVIADDSENKAAKQHALYDNEREGELKIEGNGTLVINTSKATDEIDFGDKFKLVTSPEDTKAPNIAADNVLQKITIEEGNIRVGVKDVVTPVEPPAPTPDPLEETKKAAEEAQKAAEEAKKAQAQAELEKTQAETAKAKAEKEKAEAEKAKLAAETAKANAEKEAAEKVAAAQEAQAKAEQAKAEAEKAKLAAETAKANAEKEAAEKAKTQTTTNNTTFATNYKDALNSLLGYATDANVSPLQNSASTTDKTTEQATQAVNDYLSKTVNHNLYGVLPQLAQDNINRNNTATLELADGLLAQGKANIVAKATKEQNDYKNTAQESESTGAMIVAKYGLTDNITLGVSLAKSDDELTGNQGSYLEGDSTYASMFATAGVSDKVEIAAGIARQSADLDGKRNINNGYDAHSFDAKTSYDTLSVYTQAKYRIPLGNLTITPKAGVAYNNTTIDAINETGAYALQVDESKQNTVSLLVGSDLTYAMPLAMGSLTAKMSLDYINTSGQEDLNARFAGGTSFAVKSENGGSGVRVGGSVGYQLPKGFLAEAGVFGGSDDKGGFVKAGYKF